MKRVVKIILPFLVIATGFTACLKEKALTIDPSKEGTRVVTLQFIEGGSGTTINSGMPYFSGGALLYPANHLTDTATYNVALGGPVLDKDLTVTIGVDPNKALDNYSSDSIEYEIMPDTLYKLISTTATIKAGEATAPLQIEFYPAKTDPLKSYMLPIVITDAQGETISSNYSTIYLHVIGNPIAGLYTWDYTRYNAETQTGTPSGFEGEEAVFAPANTTTIVATSGYIGATFSIDFVKDGEELKDFRAYFNAAQTKFLTDQGISIVAGPTLTVSADFKTFEVNYSVYNGAAFRNLTDKFYR